MIACYFKYIAPYYALLREDIMRDRCSVEYRPRRKKLKGYQKSK